MSSPVSSPALTSTQFRLASRPVGLPTAANWDVTTQPVNKPGQDELVVRVDQISLDPAMRGWMNAGPSYMDAVGIGDVMRAFGVGEVVASRHPRFPVGAMVMGEFGVQTHVTSDGTGVRTIDPTLGLPVSNYLGALGVTGLTAYFGLLDVGEFEAGQTVLVSGAAGGVGGVVGQIVALMGGRAIGIAGGPEKCRHLVDDLGFHGAVDYKNERVLQAVHRLAPNGVNVFFDNVGGPILDAGLANLAMGARVVICGAISTYNDTAPAQGPQNYRALLVKRARMEGMVVLDYADRFDEAIAQLGQWVATGRLTAVEDVVRGPIQAFPDTLMRLFEGKNVGKQILEITR